MEKSVLLCFILLLIKRENVTSLRLLELRVPTHVAEGNDVLLGCNYELEGDELYAVKWYKDMNEFYRYEEKEERAISFAIPGVNVDMSRSTIDTLWIKNVTNLSSGIYMCEVAGEGPMFPIVSDSKKITVYLTSKSGPFITGGQSQYKVGDIIDLNCTSPPSRPPTQLTWWLNDELVPSGYTQGPWKATTNQQAGAVVTILQLKFTVLSKHFRNETLKLKCEAAIAPLYSEQTVFHAYVLSGEPEVRIETNYNKTTGHRIHVEARTTTEIVRKFEIYPDDGQIGITNMTAFYGQDDDSASHQTSFPIGIMLIFSCFTLVLS